MTTADTASFLSIVVPVYQPDPAHFEAAVASVLAQTDPDWELVLVADGPQPEQVLDIARCGDPRVRLVQRAENGGIVAATNDGLAAASGTFVGFLDNDDTLAPNAVAAFHEAIRRWDDVDALYSDEDKLNPAGDRCDHFPKPSWSPERLLCQMYLNHFTAYRRSLVEEVGGLRQDYHGSQDFDLALRVTERARRVVHVPQILYHWRQAPDSTALDPSAKTWAFEAGVRAVGDALARREIPAVANMHPTWPGVVCVDPVLTEFPLVSIVMLTGGTRRVVRGTEVTLVENSVRSVLEHTTYPNFELVVVFDRNSSDALIEQIETLGGGRVRAVRDTRAFNYSAANNLGATATAGEYLVFLNDDTEVITPDWLQRLVLFSLPDEVGAVGAALEFADGRIQHAGVSARCGGPAHPYLGYLGTDPGEVAALALTRNTLAVTGACLCVSAADFDAVGGFTTTLPLNFNDVDFCLKLIRMGRRNVVDMRTRLVHLEHSSRPRHVDGWEHLAILRRWLPLLHADPWDNPNFTTENGEQLPPPLHLTQLREQAGELDFPARSWPLEPLGTDASTDQFIVGRFAEVGLLST